MRWPAKLRQHWALTLYAVLHMLPFAWAAATWDGFWASVAPFSTLLALAVLVALLRRRRWAWLALIALDVVVLVSFVWEPGAAVGFVMAAAGLALLLSPPIRAYVRAREPSAAARRSADASAPFG